MLGHCWLLLSRPLLQVGPPELPEALEGPAAQGESGCGALRLHLERVGRAWAGGKEAGVPHLPALEMAMAREVLGVHSLSSHCFPASRRWFGEPLLGASSQESVLLLYSAWLLVLLAEGVRLH